MKAFGGRKLKYGVVIGMHRCPTTEITQSLRPHNKRTQYIIDVIRIHPLQVVFDISLL